MLFKQDLARLSSIIKEALVIIEKEDTSRRLGETQFGYQSLHYVVKLPKQWMSMPSFVGFDRFQAEV